MKPIVLDETGVSKYSIYDVVLPLPGYDVIYPSNEGMLRVMVNVVVLSAAAWVGLLAQGTGNSRVRGPRVMCVCVCVCVCVCACAFMHA